MWLLPVALLTCSAPRLEVSDEVGQLEPLFVRAQHGTVVIHISGRPSANTTCVNDAASADAPAATLHTDLAQPAHVLSPPAVADISHILSITTAAQTSRADCLFFRFGLVARSSLATADPSAIGHRNNCSDGTPSVQSVRSASVPPPRVQTMPFYPGHGAHKPAVVHSASASPDPISPFPQPPQQPQPSQSLTQHRPKPQPHTALPSHNGQAVSTAAAAAAAPFPNGASHADVAAALLLRHQVAHRFLASWPDTLHQFERETGLCFDLGYFTVLLSIASYSAASDYLVYFWIHPYYRTTLSRLEHSRVRHALVSVMELKLTLLCMTTDRLSIDYFIEKELKPKLLALNLSVVDVEQLVRKAYSNVRVCFDVAVQPLRHSVWYELARAVESAEQRKLEEEMLVQYLRDPQIVHAHRQLRREIRMLPFHFAHGVQQANGAASASASSAQRHGAQQPMRDGEEEKEDERREEDRGANEESASPSALPPHSVPPPPVLPPINFRHHDRHRKRHHSEERRQDRDGMSERRHKRRSTTNATREVIELHTDSDRTATDDEEDGREQQSSSHQRGEHSLASPEAAAAASSRLTQSSPSFADPFYSQSPPDVSAASSPIADDMEPLSSHLNHHHRMHLSALQQLEDVHTAAHSAHMDAGGHQQNALQAEAEPTRPPPSNPAGYVDIDDQAEHVLAGVEESKEESKEHQPAGSANEMSAGPEAEPEETVESKNETEAVPEDRSERKDERDSTHANSSASRPLSTQLADQPSPTAEPSPSVPQANPPSPLSTASSTEPPAIVLSEPSVVGRWKCASCTFFNSSARTLCEICGHSRRSSTLSASTSSSPPPTLTSTTATAALSTLPAVSKVPPPVLPALLGCPLPPRGTRLKQTARKSTGNHPMQ